MLQSFGCDVTLVDNGKAAIDSVFENRVDVVLMDCQMPVMDGFEATRTIRLRESQNTDSERGPIPIVALTANAMKDDRNECLAAGMNEYLSKPYTRDQLAAVLEQQTRV